ncbi:pyridoxal phosphate-dependent aminotransferase [Undibacterium umbellatum]|uniref:Aminotransferase n=1 Tax=Undibacterium umbellatum TaxID=2762300 RepID=A0ABR6ZDV1_9BURK|nr:pyridoxal phosphate-dependent aminotransferase [Undibacterium umbellatum]MBC3909922.1 pyridoxal phosphate-dependent aminotransferase [Undibacterium umbellatum]
MHQNLAARLDNIAPFHVMELMKMAAELEQQGRHLIHMGIGEPDFTAPQAVIDAAAKAMAAGRLQYTSALGLPALRTAISQHYRDVFGLEVAASRIIVTAGASAALLLACAALVEPGREVLMPDPCYPCNRHFVAAFEGRAKLIASGPDHRFQLTEEIVRQQWDERSSGVLLASPSNPTGTSIEHEELGKIVATVKELGGFSIVDEIYQGLTYDGSPFSALSLDEDVVVINSFSKYFNMTGWRLGWLVVPERIVPALEKLAQNLFICPSSIAQYAALACFEPATMSIYEERRAEFKRRRDYIVPALRELGFGIPVMPDGAFYVYADCSRFTDDADAFAKQVLNEAGVVIVPGLDFGPATATSYVRLSYANSFENLQEAVARLKKFLANK